LTAHLYDRPQVLAMLSAAKEVPEDDTPRLVLADWLEDSGDPGRAEFIRPQCRGPRGDAGRLRQKALLDRHGGPSHAPLWRWPLGPLAWHRGLLSAGLPLEAGVAEAGDALPWVDNAILTVTGRRAPCGAAAWLALARLNHAGLDLRRPLGEGALLGGLAGVPERPALRSLTLGWPLGLLSREGGSAVPSASAAFLGALLSLPVARRITHLASRPAFTAGQEALVAARGVVPVAAEAWLWTHELPPASFRARPA